MPTHLFLQAGVGSFAGSIMGYFIEKMQQQAPTIIIVEPHKANCLFRSATINDGLPHSVGGDMSTLMAGLACGEPYYHQLANAPRPCHLFYFRRRLSGGQRHAPVGRSATRY